MDIGSAGSKARETTEIIQCQVGQVVVVPLEDPTTSCLFHPSVCPVGPDLLMSLGFTTQLLAMESSKHVVFEQLCRFLWACQAFQVRMVDGIDGVLWSILVACSSCCHQRSLSTSSQPSLNKPIFNGVLAVYCFSY